MYLVRTMSDQRPPSQRQQPTSQVESPRYNGHNLVVVTERLPGTESSASEIDLAAGPPYASRTQYWRCRTCGQERTHRTEFRAPCDGERRPHPLSGEAYSVDDPRTRRALSEAMDVRFGERGPTYVVASESGCRYEVDIEAATCTCPDHQKRGVTCKHIRRVELEIRTGVLPQPDGTLRR